MPRTPNLDLNKPIIGPNGDSATDAAAKINSNFDKIDEHDHSLGKGNPVRTSGINLDADISFNNNGAYDIKHVSLKGNLTQQEVDALRNNTLFLKDGNLSFKTERGTVIVLLDGGATVTPVSITDIGIQSAGARNVYRMTIALSDGTNLVTNTFSLTVNVATWAEEGNTDQIPGDKLGNVQGSITDEELVNRLANLSPDLKTRLLNELGVMSF